MRKLALAITALLITFHSILKADEGMWLPLLMNQQNFEAMKARGFRLTAEDLYSVNHASLKDAVVLFGRGCTAELVSAQGLILTNHHCGFSRIQSHSSVTHDYLTDGFWAMNKSEELPNKGLTASILVRMEDVTAQINQVLKPDMSEKSRGEAIQAESKKIIEEATKNTHYTAEVKPFFYGNQFILVVMEVFQDVRLVGAPPSSIGKFGGDTDNWMWPRHTGDFSIFRIYANKDNKPAIYSKDNVPYKPGKFFEISLKGIQEGDFTMVYGFPYQTEQYLPSRAIGMFQKEIYPITIEVRDAELEIINHAMTTSDELRIMYAARQAGVANAWKKYKGVIPGLEQYEVIAAKKAQEMELLRSLSDHGKKQKEYASILEGYQSLYESLTGPERWNTYFTECFWKQPFFKYLFKAYRISERDLKNPETTEKNKKIAADIHQSGDAFYKSIDLSTEQKLMAEMVKMFVAGVPESELPGVIARGMKGAKGDVSQYINEAFRKSVFGSAEKADAFFGQWKSSSIKSLSRDPLYLLMKDVVDTYLQRHHQVRLDLNQSIDSLHRLNMKIIMDHHTGYPIYPDANATLRISFGQAQGSYPADGVRYLYKSTLDGIFMKEDAAIEDYFVPQRLKDVGQPEHYGPYGEDGTLPVAFIATNHTTGGNSGSPVLNADGRLIGINFDRAWEGTMSDLHYEPAICRNISIDIRYLLFIVDKYANATHLLDEMVIHH